MAGPAHHHPSQVHYFDPSFSVPFSDVQPEAQNMANFALASESHDGDAFPAAHSPLAFPEESQMDLQEYDGGVAVDGFVSPHEINALAEDAQMQAAGSGTMEHDGTGAMSDAMAFQYDSSSFGAGDQFSVSPPAISPDASFSPQSNSHTQTSIVKLEPVAAVADGPSSTSAHAALTEAKQSKQPKSKQPSKKRPRVARGTMRRFSFCSVVIIFSFRLRVGAACEPCRRFRVKCDGQRPCTSCVKAKRSEQCISQIALLGSGVSVSASASASVAVAAVRRPALIAAVPASITIPRAEADMMYGLGCLVSEYRVLFHICQC